MTRWSSTVRLVPGKERRDRYGRRLAHVYVQGQLVSTTMVAAGQREALVITPNTRHAEAVRAAEQQARQAGRGIWGPRCSKAQH